MEPNTILGLGVMHFEDAEQTAENLRVRSESQVQCSFVPELEEHPEFSV
jgi:hypothetical protein